MEKKDALETSNEIVSSLELKLLVESIINQHANIRIKYQLDGDAWTTDFFSVMMVTKKGLVLNNDANDKIKSIESIEQILQFMIDQPFDNYVSNLPYTVS